MINIVTWLGKGSGRDDLPAACAENGIRILADGFETADEFLNAFENMEDNVDALVISDSVLAETNKRSFFRRVRNIEPNLRIIIAFPGYRNQYIEEQIAEYKEVYEVSDIIYEGRHLDPGCFVEVIRSGYVTDYTLNVRNEPEDTPTLNLRPNRCITVGVLGLTRGAGATTATVKAAEYLAKLEPKGIRAVDLTGTGDLRFAKSRAVTYIVTPDVRFDRLKNCSKGIVIDFGAPMELTPKGRLCFTEKYWDEETVGLFRDCDLKLILGFAESWQAGKMKYFLRDKQWKRRLDDTYIFLLDTDPDSFVTNTTKQAVYSRDSGEIQLRLASLMAGKGGDAM